MDQDSSVQNQQPAGRKSTLIKLQMVRNQGIFKHAELGAASGQPTPLTDSVNPAIDQVIQDHVLISLLKGLINEKHDFSQATGKLQQFLADDRSIALELYLDQWVHEIGAVRFSQQQTDDNL